jgi:hypothetical protein
MTVAEYNAAAFESYDKCANPACPNCGKTFAAEKIENVYARSKFVAQSFVYGDSLMPSLVAVVVPGGVLLVVRRAAVRCIGVSDIVIRAGVERRRVLRPGQHRLWSRVCFGRVRYKKG